MSLFAPEGALPDIVVSRDDFIILNRLASAANTETAEDLMGELERATITETEDVPANVVRMGATASYSIGSEAPRTVRLVYPADADISSGAVSVLTPIGTALLGLKPGQSIGWTATDGRELQLKVIAVFGGSYGEARPEAPRSSPPIQPFDDPGPSAA